MGLLSLFAQETPAWSKKFSKINWYKQTDAGILIVGSNDALYGVDPADGKELWKLTDFDGLKEDNYDPIAGSPYVALVNGGFSRNHYIIDATNGKLIASSKDLGFGNVTKRIEAKKLGALLFYGTNSKGKSMSTAVDVSNGNKLWEQEKLFEKSSEQIVSEAGILKDGIFLATNRNVYKLSPSTGEVLWSVEIKSDLPVVAPQKGFSAFSSKGASAAATATSADFFQYGDSSIIYFWNQDYLTAFKVADGKEVWKRVELESPVALVLHDSHGMLIATAEKSAEDIAKGRGKNRAGLYCYDYATGTNKWKNEIELEGDIVSYKMNGSKLMLSTARDKGTNYISIVDLDGGKSITKKPMKIKGEAQDLQIVPQGLYYRTNEEINILNTETGEPNWKKGFKVNGSAGANVDEKMGYVYGNSILYKMDFEKGDLAEWIKDIKFEGKEEPNGMEIKNGGVLLTSSQNLYMYSNDGKLSWHYYQKAPGRTGAGKFFSAVGGIAAVSMAAASAAQSAQMSYAKGYYGSTSPSLDNAIKNQNNMTSAWGSAGISSFKSIGRRFTASKSTNDFQAILCNFGDNNTKENVGIVCINKNDGKEGKRIVFSDKDPDYQLDEIDHLVFFKKSNDELVVYKY